MYDMFMLSFLKLVMGPVQIFLTRELLGQFFVARVRSVIVGLGLGLENFP